MGKKILLVEDHPATQQMFQLALEGAGYEVRAASNGMRLLKYVRDWLPSAVVMDVMMPWVDGFELCRTIRDTDEVKDTPVILVTAKSAPEDRQKAKAAGATEFLEKPVEIRVLLETVARHAGA